jgi:hypothetical protein
LLFEALDQLIASFPKLLQLVWWLPLIACVAR